MGDLVEIYNKCRWLHEICHQTSQQCVVLLLLWLSQDLFQENDYLGAVYHLYHSDDGDSEEEERKKEEKKLLEAKRKKLM